MDRTNATMALEKDWNYDNLNIPPPHKEKTESGMLNEKCNYCVVDKITDGTRDEVELISDNNLNILPPPLKKKKTEKFESPWRRQKQR